MLKISRVANRRELSNQLIWFLTWVGVTAVGLYLSPDNSLHGTHQQLGLPPCPSVVFFDRPCLGCGMTTSVAAFLHLSFATSWLAHPFGGFLYIIYTVSALIAGWGWLNRTRIDTSTKSIQRSLMGLTMAFVVFGIARFTTTTYKSEIYARYQKALSVSTSEKSR